MIITVTQYNNFLKGVIDSETMLSYVQIEGEIANYKESYDSLYFSITDGISSMDCFAYRQGNSAVANGTQVIVGGRANFLTKSGKLSFFVTTLKVKDGLGEKLKQLLLLKQRLQKEGCFDVETKPKVSTDSRNIGVVSSPNGAVIHDIEKVVRRRNPSVNVILFPAKVQGIGSEQSIANGIKYFNSNHNVDVIIVARGGGSNEDLSAFNSEEVVRAVCSSKIPVVSAVGHDVDFTLCDYAASIRCATPTEAGELTTVDVASRMDLALQLLGRIKYLIGQRLSRRYETARSNLDYLSNLIDKRITKSENKLSVLSTKLNGLSPLTILSRGYAEVSKDNVKVYSSTQLNANDEVKLTFSDGAVNAKVIGRTK